QHGGPQDSGARDRLRPGTRHPPAAARAVSQTGCAQRTLLARTVPGSVALRATGRRPAGLSVCVGSRLSQTQREGDMGRLRDRGRSAGTQYRMREKMFAIGDDFWVETEGGERALKVNGKALRIRDTLVLESPSG